MWLGRCCCWTVFPSGPTVNPTCLSLCNNPFYTYAFDSRTAHMLHTVVFLSTHVSKRKEKNHVLVVSVCVTLCHWTCGSALGYIGWPMSSRDPTDAVSHSWGYKCPHLQRLLHTWVLKISTPTLGLCSMLIELFPNPQGAQFLIMSHKKSLSSICMKFVSSRRPDSLGFKWHSFKVDYWALEDT